MIEDRVVTIGSKEYVMQFPSLGRVRELGRLLKFDALREGITKANFADAIENEETIDKVLKLILGDIDSSKLMDEMTGGDLQMLAVTFFLKSQQAHLKLSNGLSSFVDIFNSAILPVHREDIPSTSQSIPSAADTRKT